MNKYETWLKANIKPEVTARPSTRLEDRLRELYTIHYDYESTSVSTHGTLSGLGAWVYDVNPPTTEPTRTVPRAEHREEQRRTENHSDFRAFLGYGQGRNRIRRNL